MSKLLNAGGKAGDLLNDINLSEPTGLIVGQFGVSVVLLRGSSELATQTAVIGHVSTRGDHEMRGEAGSDGRQTIYLIGHRGHATEPDLDIERGDIWTYNGTRYQVEMVDTSVPGRVRAQLIGRQ